MTPIFYVKNGNLSFADKVVLSDIELYISKGDKICLIGRNGCGKSSLMKIFSGDYELDNGEIFQNPSIKIGYLQQDINVNSKTTIQDFILQETSSAEHQIDMILDKLCLDGKELISNCSGGQIRRACLAKVLVLKPEILLLDEPTNHLDILTIEWLEEFVKSYEGAIVCVSHDRAFLTNVTNKIWWLDRGILRKSDKGFKYFEEWQEFVLHQEEVALRKLNKKLSVENDWLNAGVTARRKRNQKRLGDLKGLRETLKQRSASFGLAKQKIVNHAQQEDKKTQFIIEAENLSFSYDNIVDSVEFAYEKGGAKPISNRRATSDEVGKFKSIDYKTIIRDFSFYVKKGERIGVIGPNGSGKSTLIKLLTKQVEPQNGRVKHGTNLEISYLDQQRSMLDPNHSIEQTLCVEGSNQVFLQQGKSMHVAAYLKQFMFDPKLLNSKVSTLSGGEANRLLIAKTLAKPGNLLILDEPTNDLDMDSLEILLDILHDYKGTLIIVSHDRDFLERLVTRTLVFTPTKIIDMFGGYEDYQAFFKKEVVKKKNESSNNSRVNECLQSSLSKKMSYKHQRLLETIPIEIEKIESRIITLEDMLSDNDLYTVDRIKFEKINAELKNCRDNLEQLFNEWLNIDLMYK